MKSDKAKVQLVSPLPRPLFSLCARISLRELINSFTNELHVVGRVLNFYLSSELATAKLTIDSRSLALWSRA